MFRFSLAVAIVALVGAVAADGVAGESTAPLRAVAPGEIAYPGNGKIYLIKANGTDRRVLVSGGAQFSVDHWGGIAWSRDGRHIAFTVGNHRASERFYGGTLRLYVASADGRNARHLEGTPQGAFDPTWSPDGKQIAFAIRSGAKTNIAVIDVDGTGLRTIASSSKEDDFYWSPDWSPDGDWILFEIARSELRTSLMAVRPDGTGLHKVAAFDTDNHCICADWSPDGKRIAYQAPTPPRYDYPEIWVMNADGSGRVQITRNLPRDENPDWSPDGKRIAFYSERRGNAEIYVIAAAGGQARRVTRDPWYNGPPRWRPAAEANST